MDVLEGRFFPDCLGACVDQQRKFARVLDQAAPVPSASGGNAGPPFFSITTGIGWVGQHYTAAENGLLDVAEICLSAAGGEVITKRPHILLAVGCPFRSY